MKNFAIVCLSAMILMGVSTNEALAKHHCGGWNGGYGGYNTGYGGYNGGWTGNGYPSFYNNQRYNNNGWRSFQCGNNGWHGHRHHRGWW